MSEPTRAQSPHAYRIFRLDSAGRYMATEGLAAADDHDALIQASGMAVSQPIELWDRDRVLARIGPNSHIEGPNSHIEL